MRCPNCKRDGIDPRAVLCRCGVHLPTLLAGFLRAGTLLHHDKYRIEEALGQGGFGITYLAHHVKLKQTVAIKEFYPQTSAQRDRATGEVRVRAHGRDPYEEAVSSYRRTLERFLREGQTLARLIHPNVVRVRDLFEELGTAYIVMDYVAPARTLDDLLKAHPDKKLPDRKVREITGQLVSALDAIHRAGVCHLDIKPENVLLTPNGQVVLIDFGAARQEVSTRTTREYTDKYAPPEVPAKLKVGPASDIFELGMMIHEMLTGELPPSGLARLHPVLSGRDEDTWTPDKVSGPWRTLLTEALRLRLGERPSSVRDWWERAWKPQPPPAAKESGSVLRAAIEAGKKARTAEPPPPKTEPRRSLADVTSAGEKTEQTKARPRHITTATTARVGQADAAKPAHAKTKLAPDVAVEDVRVEHHVVESGARGLRLHLGFRAHHLSGVPCSAVAYFYAADGTPLRDKNSAYTTPDGKVAVSGLFTPSKDSWSYTDYKLFLPYKELHLSGGRHVVRLQVKVLAKDLNARGNGWSSLAHSAMKQFTCDLTGTKLTNFLIFMPYAAILSAILSAVVVAVAATFMLESWRAVGVAVLKSFGFGSVYGLAVGALLGLLVIIRAGSLLNIMLGLAIGALGSWAFFHFGETYSPDYLWEIYRDSFQAVGQWVSIGIGAAHGFILGLWDEDTVVVKVHGV